MKFPFVSRGRYDDAILVREQTIMRLESQLEEARNERKTLTDTIAVKAVGFQLYGTLNLPRDPDDEPEPRKQSPEKDSIEPMLPQREEAPLMRARDVARRRERENLAQLAEDEKENARLRENERLRLAAIYAIEKAKEEGRERALAPANGNH